MTNKKQNEMPVVRGPINDEHYFIMGKNENANIQALNEIGAARGAVYTTRGFYYDSLTNIEPGINIKEPFSRRDYDFFRPQDSLPSRHKEILYQCDLAYRKVGLIRNIIDLMSDFASQGIVISHPTRSTERFLRAWFEKVNGKERSERFLNILYRLGNVIIRRHTAKLPQKEKQRWISTQAEPDTEIEKLESPLKREIPIRYTFLDPQIVDVASKYLGKFIGKNQYILKPGCSINLLTDANNPYEKELLKELPTEMQQILKNPTAEIPLPPEKTIVYHYKKDDWKLWGDPLIYSVLDDIILYEKAKLADIAALDGAISAIRIFKLGNSEKGIYPKPAALSQLHSILTANSGGGPVTLVWTDDIDLLETETNIHQFLGSNKYEPILTAIYDGLGIPTTLTSKGGGSTGFTNNALSLKTLVERLEYGRNLLIDFWNKELKLIQKAMGFAKPATVTFTHMDLSDEVSRYNLLMNLVDRGYISWETIVERVGENVEVEKVRLKRETKDRSKNRLPKKAGPWHNPQQDFDLKKIALQSGAATPGQVGMDLKEKGVGELTKHEQMLELSKVKVATIQKGQPNQGRPKNSNDKIKRKTRTPKIKKAVAEEE